MSLANPKIAGLAILVIVVLIMLTGCQQEPDTINLTADICAAPDARCYL